jgi:hypothetical protein
MPKFTNVATCAVAAALLTGITTNAYAPGSSRWPSSVVTFYANPSNADTDPTDAENAITTALTAWGTQSRANFQFVYGGRVNDTSTGNDGRNVMLFRNATNGGAIATTYNWYSGGTLLDSDIVFWDGYVTFVGSGACYGGAYIQDIATHELGHALGLGHSSVGDATMYASYYGCSTEQRTLAADDIAGVEYLYPPSSGGSTTPSNTAPTLSITSPSNNASFVDGAAIWLAGSANDSQDGNLSGSITWSTATTYLGAGSGLSVYLPVGQHTVIASVFDTGGMSTTKQVTVNITAAVAPSGPSLTVRGYKSKGVRKADLTWNGVSGSLVKVTRNGTMVSSSTNTGKYTDTISGKGSGTFTYQVCDSTGLVCTNAASASF